MIVELLEGSQALVRRFRKTHGRRVDALLCALGIDKPTLAHWRAVASGLRVPMTDSLTFDQFAGHAAMPEPNPKLIKEKGMGADKIGKQADTLMLFQNIPWEFGRDQIAANYRAFAPLCNQTSSLSLCSHALIAASLGLERDAWYYLKWAGRVDLDDTMGNTAHGVHGAGEGGIWLVVVGGFGGLQPTPDSVRVAPRLPAWWKRLRYRFYRAGVPVEVDTTGESFTVANLGKRPVVLTIKDKACRLAPGARKTFDNRAAWQRQTLEGAVVDVGQGNRDLSALASLCRRLKEGGVRCAAYSADEAGSLPSEIPQLAGVFDAVADRNCIRSFKPDPQGFLVATQRLRVLPWNCIGIVFDAAGVEAVHRAGMLSVGIGPDATRADLVVADPSSFTIGKMAALFSSTEVNVNPYLERNIAIAHSEAKS
jgi:beta-phosphoglucomutase-like phosphatase (HAD superfamily)